MERKVEPLELQITKEGMVEILQDYHSGNDGDPAVVQIPYHQIDILIQWLQEAKAELDSIKQTQAQGKTAPGGKAPLTRA